MYKLKTSDLPQVVDACYNAKQALYVEGTFGIGKSQIIKQSARRQAQKLNRKFLEWVDLTMEQKKECIANPKSYFIFIDIRLAQIDPTTLTGIPNLHNAEMLVQVPLSWVVMATTKDAAGYVIFDEIRQAPPTVTASAYQIILDRAISDRRMANDFWVCAASNRSSDKAAVFEMPRPLHDRFDEVEVEIDEDAWVSWAAAAGINPHIIAFIRWKPDMLHKVNEKGIDKDATPRGYERASGLIGDLNVTDNSVHQLVSLAIGEAAATQFLAYCKHFKELDWKRIFNNPEVVKDFSIDKLWAIAGGLADKYLKAKTDVENFLTVLSVVACMKADFGITTLRMMKDSDVQGFVKMLDKDKVKKDPIYIKVSREYGQLLVG